MRKSKNIFNILLCGVLAAVLISCSTGPGLEKDPASSQSGGESSSGGGSSSESGNGQPE